MVDQIDLSCFCFIKISVVSLTISLSKAVGLAISRNRVNEERDCY